MQRVRKIIDKSAPLVLLFYFVIGILAYVNIWPGSAALFRSSSTSGIIFRAASTALIVLYSLSLFIVNAGKMRFPWKWFIAFAAVLLVNLMAMLFTKHEYTLQYTASLYGYLREVSVVTGWKTLWTMYLSSVSDFALGFCFLFLLPYAFNRKTQLLWIVIPIVVFMVYECGYSLVKEIGEYKKIFSEEALIYGGYNVNIGATFGDKQEFGCFLTVGFASSLLALAVSPFRCRGLLVVYRIGLVLASALFFVISFFTLCKTAILANLLMLLCAAILSLCLLFRKNKVSFWAAAGIFGVFAISVTLILIVDQFHATGFLNKFYLLVNKMFFDKVNKGIFSRFYLVADFFRGLDPLKFLFGLTKGGVNSYLAVTSVESPGLHTGFVYFQACYGLVGSLLYAALFVLVIRNLTLLFRKNVVMALLLIGCFLCTIVFNLSECEILIVSGSAAIFPFNVFCVVFPAGYLKYEKNRA